MREEIPRLLDGMQEGAQRIKRIVHDLKDFARRDDAGDKAPSDLNQVVHWWRYTSMAEREQKREALYADPAWNAYRAQAGTRVTHQTTRIMRPTAFSPMR